MKKKKWLIPIIVILVLIMICIGYFAVYYHASEEVQGYLEGSGEVSVEKDAQGLFVDGPGEEDALIFYPGAKVEYTAYLPLAYALAEDGIDCFLVKMPLNFALLGSGKAGDIMERYEYEHWYLGGHSLGGVAASMYTAGRDLNGLILLASYPTKGVYAPVLEIYGDQDTVLNMKKRAEADQYLPKDYETLVIEGGNHAQFGNYGEQKGDGETLISREKQQEITAEKIEEFVKERN